MLRGNPDARTPLADSEDSGKEQLYDLIIDAVLGEVDCRADPALPWASQRLRDTATREQLDAFLRSLPASRFPALAAHGTHAWAGDRDERFGCPSYCTSILEIFCQF